MSEIDNGSCNSWEYQPMGGYDDPNQVGKNFEVSEAFIKKFIAPYVKIIDSGEKEWITSLDQKLKGYSITFADGSIMNAKVGSCVDLSFDVNGDRKPNKKGYDQFIFLICKDNNYDKKRCFTTYFPEKTREKNLENCARSAYYCSALLQWDNWEFKDDYPYKL